MSEVIWRPSLRSFLKRVALSGVIMTILFGGPLWSFGLLQADWVGAVIFLLSMPVNALFYAIIFDELTVWNRHRNDEWQLTATELHFRNTDDSLAFSAMPLSDIKAVRRSFWRGLVIRLHSGKSFTMNYLPQPHAVQRTLTGALPPQPAT